MHKYLLEEEWEGWWLVEWGLFVCIWWCWFVWVFYGFLRVYLSIFEMCRFWNRPWILFVITILLQLCIFTTCYFRGMFIYHLSTLRFPIQIAYPQLFLSSNLLIILSLLKPLSQPFNFNRTLHLNPSSLLEFNIFLLAHKPLRKLLSCIISIIIRICNKLWRLCFFYMMYSILILL